MKQITALLLMSMAWVATFAAPKSVNVTATMDSTVLEMGSQSLFTITVNGTGELPQGWHIVDIPEPDRDYHGVDVVSVKCDTVSSPNGPSIVYTALVQAFDPGTVEIPPVAVALGDGDTVFSRAVAMKVLPIDVDSLETINPLAPVAEHPRRWYDWIPDWWTWVVAGVLLAMIVAIAIYLYTHRARVMEMVAAKPVPPFEKAIARMQTLRTSKLAESGNEKTYYTELTDILREYLEGRFGINALEMTSTEIVQSLRQNEETRLSAEQVRAILQAADFVKFAKMRPVAEDNLKAFNEALDFIEKTKPAAKPENEADGKAPAKD